MTGKMERFRKAAGEINLHMRQLMADGIRGPAVLPQMAGYLPVLQEIMTTTTDAELSALLQDHPLFHEFARLMEEGAAVEREKIARSYDDLPVLPEPLKKQLIALLVTGSTLETALKSALEESGHGQLSITRRH